MTIDFEVNGEVYGEYCLICHAPNPTKTERTTFICSICGNENDRMLIIDPKLHWWVDDRKHYCHESVGILLINPEHQILFFDLTKFPYGWSAPAGHVDAGETPLQAVIRETREEVGIMIDSPIEIIRTMINGDSCRRGSDDHLWTLYVAHVPAELIAKISIDEHEGKKPTWVSMADVSSLEVPPAMRFLFKNYTSEIQRAVE